MTRHRQVLAPHAPRPTPAAPPATVDVAGAGSTPILREYRAVKAQHPDALVLVRLGDFYELFGEDAERAAPILGVTLTGRGFGSAGRVPMCGVPHHAVTGHVRRLLDAGLRVAVWDQVEGGALGSGGGGLVRREVTRVLSPGTLLDDAFLDAGTAARCVALLSRDGRTGLAAFDAASGELQLCELEAVLGDATVADECERLGAAELLLPEGTSAPAAMGQLACKALPAPAWDAARGAERLCEVAGTATLAGLGVDDMALAHGAAGALLAYCERSRLSLTPGFVRVRGRIVTALMRLDAATRRNLELTAPLGAGDRSLLQLLDRTRTPMGSRLLRRRLCEPLLDPAAVGERLDAVAALAAARLARAALREALGRVRDLERLVGRCVQGLASPRDLAAVRDACDALPAVATAVAPALEAAPALAAAARRCLAPPGLGELLSITLVDDPPASARDGGSIRQGADDDLDALHTAAGGSRAFLASLEQRERQRTGIRSLRVGYNRVFGYYLEIPNAQRAHVPDDYVRKQTLVGAERYITADLKEHESTVLSARERALAREAEILERCRAAVAGAAGGLLAASEAAADLDVAQSLATVADEERWARPAVDASTVLTIEAGRHPLVERSLPAGAFVPNDCALEAHAEGGAPQLLVLTGPNMAGKSTYLRQVAVITLLAQVGSFVPARSARIGACDRIFTRVGAHDDLGGGLSTFMVEMTETALILNAATPRSLVILDEIGRGTSTYDGLSIAQAVVEHLHAASHLGCRTLFATHYHELTALAGQLAGVRNARVDVDEDGDHVTFLHRIVEGAADRSYGLHVARLAGVPAPVLARARRLLADLEAERPLSPGARSAQLSLPLSAEAHPVVDELAGLDLDGLTPLAALNKLAEWRQLLAR